MQLPQGPQEGPARMPAPDTSKMTKTQAEVAGYLAKGMRNDQIAEKLFIQPDSVKFHVCALMRIFNVNSRYKVICALYDAGWR